MANLMQRISVLLRALIDNPGIPPDIVEVAEDLEPKVDDAINGILDPLEEEVDED